MLFYFRLNFFATVSTNTRLPWIARLVEGFLAFQALDVELIFIFAAFGALFLLIWTYRWDLTNSYCWTRLTSPVLFSFVFFSTRNMVMIFTRFTLHHFICPHRPFIALLTNLYFARCLHHQWLRQGSFLFWEIVDEFVNMVQVLFCGQIPMLDLQYFDKLV